MMRDTGDRYVLYQRHEGAGQEEYIPVGCWLGREPTREEMSALIPKQVAPIIGKEELEVAPSASGGSVEASPPTTQAPGRAPGGTAAVEKMPWD